MIVPSSFRDVVSPGLLRIFDEVYGQVFLGGDTIKVRKGAYYDRAYNFIDTVFMDDLPPLAGPGTWLW